ncbi:hypothetical protein EDB89DRAFT_2247045 [Lactarius sanguifluus]|nr:hypothetical protein EDB89DRAFT_2247045 [Lactarius sanguifluus]
MCLEDREPITGAAPNARVGGSTVGMNLHFKGRRRIGMIAVTRRFHSGRIERRRFSFLSSLECATSSVAPRVPNAQPAAEEGQKQDPTPEETMNQTSCKAKLAENITKKFEYGTNRPSWMSGAHTTKIRLESGWHAIHEFAMPGKSKDDENGTLDFAGSPNTPIPGVQRNDDRSLFHSTSAPLSSKFYKVLSSDPGGQTTFLLGHISAARYFRTGPHIHPTEAISSVP